MSVSNPDHSTTPSSGSESPSVPDVVDHRLARATILPVEDVVYCLSHTTVHADTTDPYGEGPGTCMKEWGSGISKAMVHRRVLYRARKGDIDERLS